MQAEIQTSQWGAPFSTMGCEWSASIKGDALSPTGWGPTEQAAIAALEALVIEQRILSRTRLEKGCLIWLGCLDRDGYGLIKGNRVHRAVYQIAHGPIPDGYDVDHICFNRACCYPQHLRALPRNVNRSLQRSALSKTCKHGHPFDELNTYIRPDGRQRQCRACNAAAAARYKSRMVFA